MTHSTGMPLPRSLGPFNRTVAFRMLGPLGGKIRPFAIVTHTGRRSGNTYETLVLAFERDGTVAIAMTYGSDVDWVRNVFTAGGASIDLGGKPSEVANPRLVGDEEGASYIPAPVRSTLRALNVHEYLLVDRVR